MNPAPAGASGWVVFRSDAGRFWATRLRFDDATEAAGVWRTVDADDATTLAELIAEQEQRARSAL
ncbi:hypothetical protein Ssi03_59680 [Sphaerisporangium siamense]|uniref:Uncharacterized protein n=2 Tax=Sphaerisporangium TaxID=321315 RepID=A0A7W8Z2N8_9ACTN|nr:MULTISPECIES: hypothetical protein [Sphaerisporangium]MBB4699798.1 hypothetical protein [Sphaerisporangium siamense]MBB5626309.1 hypothetical protein [Sphaerisporangium krabiense]GII66026.1 hypothetical protein Skr01_61110 [Sphaerisporangium krabiense]GII87978.1 hypothetical protein Ssi03_59680 [Sphaerisporangium siamense]